MGSEEFEKADSLCNEGEYQEAFQRFLNAATKGDVSAMERVAVMYSCGEGIALNFDESIKWDEKAIDGGSSIALGNLAITYRSRGDLRKAKHYFEKSLNAGHGKAALNLAKLYLVSEKEIDKVISYLEIALEHDYISDASREEAEDLLGELRDSPDDDKIIQFSKIKKN